MAAPHTTYERLAENMSAHYRGGRRREGTDGKKEKELNKWLVKFQRTQRVATAVSTKKTDDSCRAPKKFTSRPRGLEKVSR